jgi:toxin-antitoxin system PIN domain toxin
VIVVDANLLLYAYDDQSPFHDRARIWTEQVFSDAAPVGLPWQTINTFVRIVTHPRLPGQHFSMKEAIATVEQWLTQPNIRPLSPGERHWPIFQQMLLEGQAHGPMTTDAQLAALTIEYGGVLHTTDRDFARFPGLRWVNPLLNT